VLRRPLARRDAVVDGAAYDRVHELERPSGRQHLGGDESVHGRSGAVLVESCEGRGTAQVGVGPEHGDGPRQGVRLRGAPAGRPVAPSNAPRPCRRPRAGERRRRRSARAPPRRSRPGPPAAERQDDLAAHAASHRRDAPAARRQRHHRDRALARPRKHPDHPNLPTRRSRAQGTSARPHRPTQHHPRTLPAPRTNCSRSWNRCDHAEPPNASNPRLTTGSRPAIARWSVKATGAAPFRRLR